MQVTTSNLPACAFTQAFGRLHAIVDGQAGIQRVQSRGVDHARREIDGRDGGAGTRQRLGQQAAAAAHVEHARAAQRRALRNVARAHRIELVQRFELAVDVPEAMRGGVEFGDFRRVACRSN